jgi:hypothetical protein
VPTLDCRKLPTLDCRKALSSYPLLISYSSSCYNCPAAKSSPPPTAKSPNPNTNTPTPPITSNTPTTSSPTATPKTTNSNSFSSHKINSHFTELLPCSLYRPSNLTKSTYSLNKKPKTYLLLLMLKFNMMSTSLLPLKMDLSSLLMPGQALFSFSCFICLQTGRMVKTNPSPTSSSLTKALTLTVNSPPAANSSSLPNSATAS